MKVKYNIAVGRVFTQSRDLMHDLRMIYLQGERDSGIRLVSCVEQHLNVMF